jgi:transcriptional regulator with XRE-family HTH domain
MKEITRYKADRLAATLEGRGIKQRWLAEQLGIHESIVSDWTNGRRTLSESRARQVAKVIGIPFIVLFGDTKVSIPGAVERVA